MSIKRIAALSLCAVLIALCVWQVYQIKPLLQYVVSAPEIEAPAEPAEGEKQDKKISALEKTLQRIEQMAENWSGIISAYAVTSDAARINMEGVGARTAAAHLTGEYGGSAALPDRLMAAGRAFYPEELRQGDKVIILDELLAIALFRTGDPIGRTVRLENGEYTVVGIARHSRAAGDMEEYGAYVPLLALTDLPMQSLTVWGKGVAGAGAQAKFKADMEAWQAGNLFSLTKERSRAVLPVWLLLTTIGLLLLLMLYRAYGQMVLRLTADYRRRLEHCFAVQMTPRLAAYALLSALLLLALLLISYGWAQVLLWPVNIFPEWIPAVPVEISDILTTYWQNVSDTCGISELRSAQEMTLRMWHMILRLLCLLEGAVAVHSLGMLRGRQLREKRSTAAENA